MNQDKISKFIKNLREESNMTQEELADKIPISRQAISKWERGISIPDAQTLIRLSEIFNLSINEILSGEKINKTNANEINKITLKLYEERNKVKKSMKFLMVFMALIIILFLLYYFLASYRSVKVYTISGTGENVAIASGIFVETKDKYYFTIGGFDYLNDDLDIKALKLFYKDNKGEHRVVYTTRNSIYFSENIGYNEYLNKNNIKNILKNLFLNIKYQDREETFKLTLNEDYINDKLFNTSSEEIGDKKSKTLDVQDKELMEKIKAKYKYQNNNYEYTINNNDITESIYFNDEIKTIKLIVDNGHEMLERWDFYLEKDRLEYKSFKTDLYFYYKNNKYIFIGNTGNNGEEKLDLHNKAHEKTDEFYSKLEQSLK